jgi:hypothetical protein
MDYRDRDGKRQRESTNTEDWDEAQKTLRERLQARDSNTLPLLRKGEQLTFSQWSEHFLEAFSKPPIRARKTHLSYTRVTKHLNSRFGEVRLVDLTAEVIEAYLRRRLQQRVEITRSEGKVAKGLVKPSTVHQEFRVLRRMLNVAVRKKLFVANPCSGVEFPVRVKGLFRPHYVTWSEQQKIEAGAPDYLRNVIRIITETGLRVYKELAPMKKEEVDLANAIVWIPDSKTASGVADVPLSSQSRRSRTNSRFPARVLTCSRIRIIPRAIRRASRRSGRPRFGKPGSLTSGFTIYGQRTRLVSAPGEWPMNGSHSSSDRETRRFSKSIRR